MPSYIAPKSSTSQFLDKTPTPQATPTKPSVTTPTSTGAYSVGIRSALNGKGVDNSRIAYDPYKGVTVDGNQFITPSKNYGGAAYTNQTGFNNAWNAFNQPKKPNTGAVMGAGVGAVIPTTSPGQYAPQQPQAQPQQQPVQQQQPQTYNPYTQGTAAQNPFNQQTMDAINALMQQAQNPVAYDPYSSAEYAAYKADQDRKSHDATRQAQEAFGGAGFGRSYALGERAQGIQNTENEYLDTQVIPTLLASHREQEQQKFNNAMSALNPLLGQQSRGDSLAQQDWSNNYNVGQLTGNYMPNGAQDTINHLIGLKQRAEAPGITADERAKISAEADTDRSRLASLGVNPAAYGANVASGNVQPYIGERTLGGQSQDLSNKNANLNAAGMYMDATGKLITPQGDWSGLVRQANDPNAVNTMAGQNNQLDQTQVMAALTGHMPDGTPTTAEQQRQLGNLWAVADATGTIPDELASLYGIPKGTQTQQAKQFAMNFNQGAKESDRNFGLQQDEFKYGQLQDEAKADAGTKATPAQVKQILQNYQLTGQDPNGKSYKYNPGPGTPKRKEWVSNTVQSLVNAGYDNGTIEQVLRSAGVTPTEEDEIFGGTSGK